MRAAVRWSFAALVAIFVVEQQVSADWPGFRGPAGDGVSSESSLPVEWTKDNILWKVKLPGPGAASPIVVGDKVFVTGYSGYGTVITKGFSFGGGFKGKGDFGKKKDEGDKDEQKKLKLHVLCLDSAKGDVVWTKDVEPKLPEVPATGFLREHGYASSTPVSDGEAIYVFFGKSGVFAYDLKGKKLWHVSVGTGTDKWGSASSLVLHNNLVIVNAGIESSSLVALDRKTGNEVWRKKFRGTNWTTPLLAKTKEGKTELVLSLPGKVIGYDPDKGEELWQADGIGNAGQGYTISTPVARDGIVYVIGGGGPTAPATAIAIRTGGRGDVNKTHVVWRQKAGTSTVSPVLSGDNLCWVAGNVVCLDIKDGKTVHQERLYEGRGEYVSSVAAGDKVFALTRLSGLYVLDANAKFKNLAHNEFKGDSSIFNASPAVSDGRIYIRSNEYLYCIGKR